MNLGINTLGLILIVLGLPVLFLDDTPGSEMPLMAGLFIVFISTEKTEDERSVSLKTSSLYFSFIICYALKLIASNLHSNEMINWQLLEINHFIIAVFAIALIIYNARLRFVK